MRVKGRQPILLALMTWLLIGHPVESQETTATAAPTTILETTPHTTAAAAPTAILIMTEPLPTCQSYSVDRNTYCSAVSTTLLDNQLASGLADNQVCAYPLQQYACSMGNIPNGTLAAALRCSIANPDVQSSQGDFVLLLSRLPLDTVREALDLLNTQISGSDITPQAKQFMLIAVWEKLSREPQLLTSGFVASWFQERLHFYLPAINVNILNCFTGLGLTCDGLESMVQALDIVYPNIDNGTKIVIVNWIQSVLSRHNGCGKASVSGWIAAYWKSFQNDASYDTYVRSWSELNVSESLVVLTPSQLAEYAHDSMALSSEESSRAINTTLVSKDPQYMLSFLDKLQTLNTSIDLRVQRSFLKTTVIMFNDNFPDACLTSFEKLMQDHLGFLLGAINFEILDLLPKNIGCGEFKDICKGLHPVKSILDLGQQEDVVRYMLQFLTEQARTQGGACTFGTVSSIEWMEMYFGSYSYLVNYSTIMELNPGFRGFDVLDKLSPVQMVDLLKDTGILNISITDADTHMDAVMVTLSNRSFAEFTEFMIHFRIVTREVGITVILSNIRCRMLRTIWTTLVPQFSTFNNADFNVWFNERLPLFFPCIKGSQLLQLDIQQNCTRLHTIVSGFSSAFANMDLETKTTVSNWIVSVLTSNTTNTTTCASANWLNDNFQGFSGIVTVKQIMAANPDYPLLQSVMVLTAEQIGEAVILIPECLSSVTIMTEIFNAVTDGPREEVIINLGQFWDSFNSEYEQDLIIKPAVQFYMLEATTVDLSETYTTMTDEVFGSWFSGRFRFVMSAINATILDGVPRSISCSKYQSLISGMNGVYNAMEESDNTKDAFNFIKSYWEQLTGSVGVQCSAHISSGNWLETNLGHFSTLATYQQLMTYNPNFNVYEDNVLYSLTLVQVSEMMVRSETLTNLNYATQLFQYFHNLSLSSLHTCMANFTTIAQSQIHVNITYVVGQYFIEQYVILISGEFSTYRESDWSWVLEYELYFFLPYVNEATLTRIVPFDCGSLFAIIGQLDAAFSKMDDNSKKFVVAWMVKLLSAQSPNSRLGGCQAGYNQTQWVATFWYRFISVATIQQMTATYQGFDVSQILTSLTTSQKIEYIYTSNALTNVTTMQTVLATLTTGGGEISLSTADEFLTLLNAEIVKTPNVTISNDVKLEILTVFFTQISTHFGSFTVEQYRHYFQIQFRVFLIYIDVDLIKLLRVEISCASFSVIMTALDGIASELGEDVKIEISNFITRFLQNQNTMAGARGNVCPALYSDSRSYMLDIYFSFIEYNSVTTFQVYYTAFDVYSVLDLCSPKQLAEQMVLYDLRDELRAAQIILQVKGFSYTKCTEFMIEFNSVSQKNNITVLPDLNIQNLLVTNVYSTLLQGVSTASDFEALFGVYLQFVMSSISIDQITSLPSNLDCQSQVGLTRGLEKRFKDLTEEQGNAVHNRIINFLTSQGRVCSGNLNSTEWISTFYGEFKVYATIAEFQRLNPSFDVSSALSECTGPQIGEYAETSGALNNERMFIGIFEYLKTEVDVSLFMTELNTNAQSQLQETTIASVMLSSVSEVISEQYPTFTVQDWSFWYQVQFRYILRSVNETHLNLIPRNIDCKSQQEIVKGLSSAYSNMTKETQEVVYRFIRRYFTSAQRSTAGIICGTLGQKSQEWLDINFGSFYVYAVFSDILQWNTHFVGSDVLQTMTFSQLADYTLASGALADDDKICPILARLHKQSPSNIYEFLDQFSLSASQMNFTRFPDVAIRNKMFVQFIGDVKVQFATYASQSWTFFFGTRFSLFLGSLDGPTVADITQNMDCDSYRIFVAATTPVYSSLSPSAQIQIFDVMYRSYLTNQFSTAGSVCPGTGEGDKEWLGAVLGEFSSQATYEQIVQLRPAFNGLNILPDLSTGQLSGFCFDGNNLENINTIQAVVANLGSRTVEDIQDFVVQFHNNAVQKEVLALTNTLVRDQLFNVIFSRVNIKFSAFTASDWDGFLNSASLLIASFNATSLEWIPLRVPCPIYQRIMSEFVKNFKDMSVATQEAVYGFAKRFLLAKSQVPGGNACTTGSDGSAEWLTNNIGSFSRFASYDDIKSLNPYFSFVLTLDMLEANFLAQVAAKEALQNPEAAGKIISAVKQSDVGDFLDEFNLRVQEQGITKLSNADVRKVMLSGIFCDAGALLATFNAAQWSDWFQFKLQFFVVSLDAKALGFIPTSISCDDLTAIVNALSNTSLKYENPEAIYNFIVSVLSARQLESDNACISSGSTDRKWLMDHFGAFAIYANAEDLKGFKNDFTGAGCSDLLSSSVVASLVVHSSVVYNMSSFSLVFDSRQMSENLDYLGTFLSTARSFSLQDNTLFGSIKVKETFLIRVLQILGPKFGSMPVANVTMWLHSMDFLLPAINATMLEEFPMTMSCLTYQAIVAALNDIFPQLTAIRKNAVVDFQLMFLREKVVSEGSACATGITSTANWIDANLGTFCQLTNATVFQNMYDGFNAVSYNGRCLPEM